MKIDCYVEMTSFIFRANIRGLQFHHEKWPWPKIRKISLSHFHTCLFKNSMIFPKIYMNFHINIHISNNHLINKLYYDKYLITMMLCFQIFHYKSKLIFWGFISHQEINKVWIAFKILRHISIFVSSSVRWAE